MPRRVSKGLPMLLLAFAGPTWGESGRIEGPRVAVGIGVNAFVGPDMAAALGTGPGASLRVGYGVAQGIGIDASLWGSAQTGRAPGDPQGSGPATVLLTGARLGPSYTYELNDRWAVEGGAGLGLYTLGTPYQTADALAQSGQSATASSQNNMTGWGLDLWVGGLRALSPTADLSIALHYSAVGYPVTPAGGAGTTLDGSTFGVFVSLLLHEGGGVGPGGAPPAPPPPRNEPDAGAGSPPTAPPLPTPPPEPRP